MSCVLLDSKEQFISRTKLDDDNLVEVRHDGWYVKIPVKVINQFKASNTLSKILSPFSLLYLYYRQRGGAKLYVAVLEEFGYFVTFEEGLALYWKIYALDGKPLGELIKEFLYDFYAQENSFFVEGIEIYRFHRGYTILEQELEDELVLPVRVYDEDLEKVCSNSEISQYFIRQKDEPKKRVVVQARFVLIVGFSIVGLLLAYDLFLRYQNDKLRKELQEAVQSQVTVGNLNNDLKSKLMLLQKVRPTLERLKEQNALLYERIKTIFDLVPSRTYLTKAEFDREMLILEGVTLHKEEVQKQIDEELKRSFQKRLLHFFRDGDAYRFKAVYEEMVSDENRTE